jgi:AAA family ATP:ADP antiporter
MISGLEESNKQGLLKIGFLKALGAAKIPAFFPLLEVFFQDDRKKVVNQAILSAGDTLHPYFVPALIDFLEEEKHRAAAQTALIKYGQEIIPILLRYIKAPQSSVEVIRALPEIMEKFGSQQTVDALFDILKEGDYSVRLATLKALNTMKSSFPFLNFNDKRTLQFILEEAKIYQGILGVLYAQIKKHPKLKKTKDEVNTDLVRSDLIQLLEKRLDNNLERIFRLLGLKYPPEDIISIYEHIQSEKADLRVNAIEYLENLLESNLKKILIPIIETALLDTISEEAISNLNLKIPDELKGFEVLMQTKDVQLKLAILHLINVQPKPSYLPIISSSSEDPHPKVSKLAREILNKQ